MTIDLTGAQIFLLIFNLLLLCLAFFIRQWMTRQQTDIDAAAAKIASLTKELHDYQLQCARDFAQRSDVTNGRAEMMDAIHVVAAKVDRLFDKLDMKADKP